MDAWLFPFLFHSSAVAELSPPPSLQQGSSQSKSLSSLCSSHRQTNPGLLVHPAGFSFSSPTPDSGPGCHYLRMFTFRRCRLGSRPPLAPEGLGTSSPLLAGAKCGCTGLGSRGSGARERAARWRKGERSWNASPRLCSDLGLCTAETCKKGAVATW